MREWIEIKCCDSVYNALIVLPRMREWIEMQVLRIYQVIFHSSPSYEGVD